MDELTYIGWDHEDRFDLGDAIEALRAGHGRPLTSVTDMLTPMEGGEVLTRAAAIEGLGAGTKTVTIRPGNPQLTPPYPTVQGVFVLFDPETGQPSALIDGALLTKWKTVADSLLGASILAPERPRTLAVIGTGPMARALAEGYIRYFGSLATVRVWGRTPKAAQALAAALPGEVKVCATACDAVGEADLVVSATSAREPVILGRWVKPGTHVDLVGAHALGMREADDELIRRASLFVDCRETVIAHIGELVEPIAAGVIGPEQVRGDLYSLVGEAPYSRHADEVTVFKNGGGAHLDVMIGDYMLKAML